MKIKGVEYPCRVTMGAMVRFKRESGKDIREVDQQDVDRVHQRYGAHGRLTDLCHHQRVRKTHGDG